MGLHPQTAMLLLIDNYDSFTYNIVQYLGELGMTPEVVRNDDAPAEVLAGGEYKALIVSPGPCTPREAGVSCEAVRLFAYSGRPVLGVCLGHQCIGEVFGGNIVHAPTLMHGKVSRIRHGGKGIFKGIPDGFAATRYHSLVIDPASVPSCLEVTARTDDGVIMAVAHRSLPVCGVQFHPESILTEHGHRLLENFLKMSGLSRSTD